MMSKNLGEVEQPVNANERFLHALIVRLDVIIDQLGALSEHIANQSGQAIEENTVTDEVPVRKSRTPKAK